jgi:hypothetical protein
VILGGAALAVAVAVGLGFLVFGTGSSEASVDEAMREAGCQLETFPSRPPGLHVRQDNVRPKDWNSSPPTSGTHHEQWVLWGAYDQPVPVVRSVHNLEHGGIVVFYGDEVPDSTVQDLNAFYRDDPTGMLLAPLPELNDEITLAAWVAPPTESGAAQPGEGKLARCTAYDETAFKAFRDEFRFEGPEAVPPENLQPGM